jgi:hypothetical protein
MEEIYMFHSHILQWGRKGSIAWVYKFLTVCLII